MSDQKIDAGLYSMSGLIRLVDKWKMHLLVVTILAIACSIVFTMPYFIKPKFKSSVILFPVATNSVSKILLSDNSNIKEDIMDFGTEDQVEQMLQILNSDDIRNRIVKKYNLYAHYGIDMDSKYPHTTLLKMFEENITFSRTEFMSVEIEVLDTDPQLAANIANDIADLLDTVKNEMQRVRALKAYQIVDSEYKDLLNQIKSIDDSLAFLRSKGVLEFEKQTEMITEQYAFAIAHNNMQGAQKLEEKLNNLAKYGGRYVELRDMSIYEREKLSQLMVKHREAKVDAEQNMPQKFVVNRAYKAEKKAYPVRWIIVVIATFSSLILALLILIFIDRVKKVSIKEL
ncbi:MAG: hypothetical protein V2A54_14540 [Bacteroidota bacterium]